MAGEPEAISAASSEATRCAIARLEAAGVPKGLTDHGRLRRWESAGLFELVDTIKASAATGSPFEGSGPYPRRTHHLGLW